MNKTLLSLLFVAFTVGQCIEINHGVFKGSFWRIIDVNEAGDEFAIKDRTWIIREVQITFLTAADDSQCAEPK